MNRAAQQQMALSEAQRILLRSRSQFADYPGVSEIGVSRGPDGQICFVITCRTIKDAEALPRVDAIDNLPVRVVVEDAECRSAASAEG